jgi:hypothetical protein
MKKLTKVVVAGILALGLSTSALAGDTMFGSLGDMVSKGRNAMRTAIPTKVQALEADGGNFRLYSWTPDDNPNITCWVAAGTQKGAGGCYPKAK